MVAEEEGEGVVDGGGSCWALGSSFNDAALLYDMLADVSLPRSQGWGTMAAMVRRRPPWFIVFYRST